MDNAYAISTKRTRSPRLSFIDNIRVFLTILVVAHHAGQAYGPTGGRWLIFNSERADSLGPFFAVNAAFFMGLFFFVAGYLTPDSYDRKGAKAFLSERLLRLGLPIALFALLIFPLVFYVLEPRAVSFAQFWRQTYLEQGQLEFGHLWFLVHLLVYAVGYALWRQVMRSDRSRHAKRLAVPSHPAIWMYLMALSGVSFIVRIGYPIDTWKSLFGLIPTEVAHLPQYLSLFILGLLAADHDWLRHMPRRRGLIWLSIGLGFALLRYGYGLG
jgi:glucans biosynthesis protein C